MNFLVLKEFPSPWESEQNLENLRNDLLYLFVKSHLDLKRLQESISHSQIKITKGNMWESMEMQGFDNCESSH
jgi:hypothetical protein